MKKIRVIKGGKQKWYKKGQEFLVKDEQKYQPYGVQVLKENNGKVPDVVMNGDFEYIYSQN